MNIENACLKIFVQQYMVVDSVHKLTGSLRPLRIKTLRKKQRDKLRMRLVVNVVFMVKSVLELTKNIKDAIDSLVYNNNSYSFDSDFDVVPFRVQKLLPERAKSLIS